MLGIRPTSSPRTRSSAYSIRAESGPGPRTGSGPGPAPPGVPEEAERAASRWRACAELPSHAATGACLISDAR